MAERATPESWAARRAWLARAGLTTEELDELEDHLLCALLDQGEHGPAAVVRALADLGAPAALVAEYRKVHTPMNLVSKLAGVLFSLGFVALAFGAGADLAVFLHVPSLLLVGGFVAGGLAASFGPRLVLRALAVGFFGRAADVEPGEGTRLDAVAVRGHRLAWASGVLGLIAGLVAAAVNLADPSQVGPGIGLSLLSLLYGALLAELGFGNLRAWIADRSAAAGEVRFPPAPTAR